MKTYEFRAKMTALSSISHNGGQSFGINSKLRREKFVQPNGEVEEVPVISGNGLRGMLRDLGMLHMCRALGFTEDDGQRIAGKADDERGLKLPAFHFLFSGGSLSGDGGKSIDIERARELRRLIPLVGIFGGAVGNMIMPGKLKMGKAIPICAETSHLLPESFRSTVSIWDLVQEEMYTRKDDSRHEHLRQAIAARDRKLLDGAAAAKGASAAAVAEEPGQAQQMMYYVETFAAGTPFYWRIVIDDVNDVEYEAFMITLAEFSRKPYIGGKSNVGLGEVSISCGEWFEVDSRLNHPGSAITRPIGTAYLSHLEQNAPKIRDLLRSM